jgi:hypothetical protein
MRFNFRYSALPIWLFWLCVLPLFVACTAVSRPAPAPNPIFLPTIQPAAGVLTATLPLSQTVPAELVLEETTAVPSPTPRPTATPVTPALALSAPHSGELLPTGTELNFSGTVTAQADWRLELVLLAPDGRLLTAVPIPLRQTGSQPWQIALTLPSRVTGMALVQANLFSADGALLSQDSAPVTLLPDPNDQRVLSLAAPVGGDTAVPGYYLYFTGQSRLPAENLIRVALLDATCTTLLREDSFRVSGSGAWQGYLPLPSNIPPGPACARAAFGPPNSENRRETLVPITVLAQDDPRASAIRFFNRLPDRALQAGESWPFFGVAYNAPCIGHKLVKQKRTRR